MAIFLITYDFNSERNYDDLYEAFEEQNVGRVMETVWLGELKATANEVREWVQGLLGDDDTILVVKMKPKHGWAGNQLVEGVNAWVKALLNPN